MQKYILYPLAIFLIGIGIYAQTPPYGGSTPAEFCPRGNCRGNLNMGPYSIIFTSGAVLTGTGSSAGVTGVGGSSGRGGDFTGGGAAAGVVGTGGGTSGMGVRGVGGDPNGTGVSGVGDGTGSGGSFTGGHDNGHGVWSVGIGTGSGVVGTGGDTNGTGITGQGAGAGSTGAGVRGTGGAQGSGGIFVGGTTSGIGLIGRVPDGSTSIACQCQGDLTSPSKGAISIVPQDTLPTACAVGDLAVVSAILYICTATTPTWTKVGTQT